MVSFLSFLLELCTPSWCRRFFHLSADFQNRNPRYFSLLSLTILVLVILTFSPSRFSIKRLTKYITRLVAVSLPTVMAQSSAYRTKYSPRFQSLCLTHWAWCWIRGGIGFLFVGIPSNIFYIVLIHSYSNRDTYKSVILYHHLRWYYGQDISLSLGTVTKNFSKSISTIHS